MRRDGDGGGGGVGAIDQILVYDDGHNVYSPRTLHFQRTGGVNMQNELASSARVAVERISRSMYFSATDQGGFFIYGSPKEASLKGNTGFSTRALK